MLGHPLSEEEILQQLLSSPNLVELKLSGQTLSVNVLSRIREVFPKLIKLTITGSVRLHPGATLAESFESLNEQEISSEMLESLLASGSPIKILDLSLTTIDDKGLEVISRNGGNLTEIYLKGASHITDKGIMALVDQLPNLKIIDLGSYILREEGGEEETLSPEVSQKTIQTLLDRGVTVIKETRRPWF